MAKEKEGVDPILGSETSTQDNSISPNITVQEVVSTLTALNTPVKKKIKRQTPMYFKTRKI